MAESLEEILSRLKRDKRAALGSNEAFSNFMARGGDAELLIEALDEFRGAEEGERKRKELMAPTKGDVARRAGPYALSGGAAAKFGVSGVVGNTVARRIRTIPHVAKGLRVPALYSRRSGRQVTPSFNLGTSIIPGVDAEELAKKEIVTIAERMTAKGMRAGNTPEQIRSDIEDEIKKQFGKKAFKEKWFERRTGHMFSNPANPAIEGDPEVESLMQKGFESGKEQVEYYEKQYRQGGIHLDASKNRVLKHIPILKDINIHEGTPGMGVMKVEQAADELSTRTRKAPVLGNLLFGKAPTQPAKRTEKLDPNVRSAMNAARLKLQKASQEIYEKKYKVRLDGIKEEADRIQQALVKKKERLDKVNERINEIMNEGKTNAPNTTTTTTPPPGGATS